MSVRIAVPTDVIRLRKAVMQGKWYSTTRANSLLLLMLFARIKFENMKLIFVIYKQIPTFGILQVIISMNQCASNFSTWNIDTLFLMNWLLLQAATFKSINKHHMQRNNHNFTTIHIPYQRRKQPTTVLLHSIMKVNY